MLNYRNILFNGSFIITDYRSEKVESRNYTIRKHKIEALFYTRKYTSRVVEFISDKIYVKIQV